MTITTIIRLLSFGFSGFAIALALLSYYLLRAEQRKRAPNADVLKRIDQFGRRAIIIAVIVAFVQLTEMIVRRLIFSSPASPAMISACRDSLSFLVAQTDLASTPALRTAVEQHRLNCADLLQRLDEEHGK